MAERERVVVVNADDLGISREVNDAIFEAHDRGVVSSATLLIGGSAVDHALDGAARRPELGIGLHLDTSEFAPVSRMFAEFRERNPDIDVRTVRLPSRSFVRAVQAEWGAQLEAARDLGVQLSHVDSHHFDHVNPVLLPSLAATIRSTGVRRVRGMHNLWVTPPSSVVVAAKAAHRVAMRVIGARTTDHMCDVGSYLTLADQDRLPRRGSIELMAHPGHPSYADETERLLAVGTDVFGTELVSWRDI